MDESTKILELLQTKEDLQARLKSLIKEPLRSKRIEAENTSMSVLANTGD